MQSRAWKLGFLICRSELAPQLESLRAGAAPRGGQLHSLIRSCRGAGTWGAVLADQRPSIDHRHAKDIINNLPKGFKGKNQQTINNIPGTIHHAEIFPLRCSLSRFASSRLFLFVCFRSLSDMSCCTSEAPPLQPVGQEGRNLFGLTIRVLFRSVEGWATLPRDPMFLHPCFLLMDGVKLATFPHPQL